MLEPVWVTMINLNNNDIDRVIEMAWEDRTPFEAIAFQFDLKEEDVIQLMRKELSANGFKRWRKRVSGRSTKHLKKRAFKVGKHKSKLQRTITLNRISKR